MCWLFVFNFLENVYIFAYSFTYIVFHMYDHTCISTQALQDLRLATLCGNPYRRSFVHLTKLKTGGCNMVWALCICKGGGGHWCISRLKIRKICRILVNIWKFNRLSLKPFVCKSCYLQFNSLANGKRGVGVDIHVHVLWTWAPPPSHAD